MFYIVHLYYLVSLSRFCFPCPYLVSLSLPGVPYHISLPLPACRYYLMSQMSLNSCPSTIIPLMLNVPYQVSIVTIYRCLLPGPLLGISYQVSLTWYFLPGVQTLTTCPDPYHMSFAKSPVPSPPLFL